MKNTKTTIEIDYIQGPDLETDRETDHLQQKELVINTEERTDPTLRQDQSTIKRSEIDQFLLKDRLINLDIEIDQIQRTGGIVLKEIEMTHMLKKEILINILETEVLKGHTGKIGNCHGLTRDQRKNGHDLEVLSLMIEIEKTQVLEIDTQEHHTLETEAQRGHIRKTGRDQGLQKDQRKLDQHLGVLNLLKNQIRFLWDPDQWMKIKMVKSWVIQTLIHHLIMKKKHKAIQIQNH